MILYMLSLHQHRNAIENGQSTFHSHPLCIRTASAEESVSQISEPICHSYCEGAVVLHEILQPVFEELHVPMMPGARRCGDSPEVRFASNSKPKPRSGVRFLDDG